MSVGGETGRHPGRVVAVPPVLAQEVADVPERGQRVIGNRERGDPRRHRPTVDREWGGRPSQEFEGAPGSLGLLAEQPPELSDGTIGTGGSDGRGVRATPGEFDQRHHDGRAEHAERRGDHLAGHLPEHAAPAGEVRRAVGKGHTVGVAAARVEAERDVVRMAFGREVDLPDHRFEDRAEPASTR